MSLYTSSFGGPFTPPLPEDSRLLINSLELRAVILALQCFEELVQGHAVLVRTDNETVVASFNHQGGSHSQSLCRLALYLWEWCLPRGIHLSASHISVEEFLLAVFPFSRDIPSIRMDVECSGFRRICLYLSPPPEVDLFASLLNFQLPKYCSWVRVLQAWRVDAMSVQWSGLRLYAFPPFSMIPSVLEKIV